LASLDRRLAIISIILIVIVFSGYIYSLKDDDHGHSSVTMIIRFGDHGILHAGNTTVWEDGEFISSTTSPDNSTSYEFYGLKGENQTVFSVLMLSSQIGNFSVDYSEHMIQTGTFVESIAGIENGEKDWQYYLNGEYGTIASDRKPAKEKDIVEWTYE